MRRFSSLGIIIWACLMCGVATFFYGPSQTADLPKDIWLVLAGLFVAGCSSAFIVVPAIPEMLEDVEKDYAPEQIE